MKSEEGSALKEGKNEDRSGSVSMDVLSLGTYVAIGNYHNLETTPSNRKKEEATELRFPEARWR